jgi:hypothetical protein
MTMARRKAKDTPRMGRPPKRGETADVLITIRATTNERDAYKRAAAANGVELSEWIRSLCDAAMRRRS